MTKVLACSSRVRPSGDARATAWVPRLFGREVLAPFQNGLIQFYAAVTALGVTGLLWILLMS